MTDDEAQTTDNRASKGCAPQCCACRKPVCLCHEHPRKWLTRAKVTVRPDTPTLSVPAQSCGKLPTKDKLRMYIRRRGTRPFALAYEEFDTDAGGAKRFLFDSRMWALPAGRYEAELRQGKFVCGSIEIKVPAGCGLDLGGVKAGTGVAYAYRTGRLEGVENVFNDVDQFTATLCRVLAPGDTTLPLISADAARLCSATLCKPVQLVLSDGVKTETVQFSACTGGAPVIARGLSGTVPAKFPIGSTVGFSWTSANVEAASCPC